MSERDKTSYLAQNSNNNNNANPQGNFFQKKADYTVDRFQMNLMAKLTDSKS